MDLDDIRLFVKVAELRSFVKAATELRVQSSLLSRRVARLEASLGVRLLNRTTRRVSLTEEGAQFLLDTSMGLDFLNSAVESLSSLHGAPRGKIRVSSPIDIGQYLIENVLPGFFVAYPDIQIDWDVISYEGGMVERGLDLSIRTSRMKRTEQSVVERRIGGLTILPFRSPKLQIKLTRKNVAETLEALPWVAFGIGELGHERVRFPVKIGGVEREILPKNVRIRTNSMASVRDLIMQGVGIGMLPSTVAELPTLRGQLVQLLPGYLTGYSVEFLAAYPSREYLAPKVRVLLDWLTEKMPSQIFGAKPA